MGMIEFLRLLEFKDGQEAASRKISATDKMLHITSMSILQVPASRMQCDFKGNYKPVEFYHFPRK
jgi:hypothetical protein